MPAVLVADRNSCDVVCMIEQRMNESTNKRRMNIKPKDKIHENNGYLYSHFAFLELSEEELKSARENFKKLQEKYSPEKCTFLYLPEVKDNSVLNTAIKIDSHTLMILH